MDEYIVYCSTVEPGGRWSFGTFEQVRATLLEWEQDPECLMPAVRRCTKPINIEFVREGIDKVAAA